MPHSAGSPIGVGMESPLKTALMRLNIRSSSPTLMRRFRSAKLRLGFDTAGRLLELVVLRFDSGTELLIHAMKARPQYIDLIM